MWTAWNDSIQQPQIWDILHQHDAELTSAVWFPMLSKGCGADYICMPAPIHNPDGSESLWCYTQADRAVWHAARRVRPFSADELLGADGEHQIDGLDRRFGRLGRCSSIRPQLLLHLSAAPRLRRPEDRPRQPAGARPPSASWTTCIGKLVDGVGRGLSSDARPLWLVASEYVITPVDHVTLSQPRAARGGLADASRTTAGGELIDFADQRRLGARRSPVFARLRQGPRRTQRSAASSSSFAASEGIAEVLAGDDREQVRISTTSGPATWC